MIYKKHAKNPSTETMAGHKKKSMHSTASTAPKSRGRSQSKTKKPAASRSKSKSKSK